MMNLEKINSVLDDYDPEVSDIEYTKKMVDLFVRMYHYIENAEPNNKILSDVKGWEQLGIKKLEQEKKELNRINEFNKRSQIKSYPWQK